MENLKITEVEVENGKWKKGKFVDHKKPIEKPKVVFQDSYTNLMDIATEARHAVERNPQNKIVVSFEINAEF
jgi:hypothetical protein